MEIKQGSVNIPLFVKFRQSGVVLTVAQFLASYGAASAVYTLEAETSDKSATESIAGTPATEGINFVLPASMFDTAQRVWTVSLKYVLDTGVTDFTLYNFEIKVTKPQSVNTR